MNRKYGLAVTAWMLGSGLLLDAGLTAESQVLSTQSVNDAKTASQNAEGNCDKPSPGVSRSRAQANHAVYFPFGLSVCPRTPITAEIFSEGGCLGRWTSLGEFSRLALQREEQQPLLLTQ